MATKRQIAANRRNARRSTGPKTAAGKAASSANALRHGLAAARAVVLPDEDADAYERLRQGVIADLDPAGALQEALAQRIVVLLWRLDRAARLEAELFIHGRLAVQRKEVVASAVRESAAAGLAAMLGEADGRRREARFQAKRAIDADIRAQAPSAQVLVERQESAKTFDRLARHEGTLQRALNRTLEDFRGLRREAAPVVAAEAAPAEAEPDPVTAPPGGAGPAARSRAAAPPAKTLYCKTKPTRRKPLKRRANHAPAPTRRLTRPAANRASEPSGTGTRSGPAGATAPARRQARSQASGASARRLRERTKVRSERPATEGKQKTLRPASRTRARGRNRHGPYRARPPPPVPLPPEGGGGTQAAPARSPIPPHGGRTGGRRRTRDVGHE